VEATPGSEEVASRLRNLKTKWEQSMKFAITVGIPAIAIAIYMFAASSMFQLTLPNL
jgi:hypothetical protein